MPERKSPTKTKNQYPNATAKDEIELLDSIIDNYADVALNQDKNVPKDQVKGLSEEVLSEEIVKTLYPLHHRSFHNIASYSYKDREFKKNDQMNQTVFHFKQNGTLLRVGSEEETNYQQYLAMKEQKQQRLSNLEKVNVQIDNLEDVETKKRLLRSHFNYNECLSQTPNPTLKNFAVSTIPPVVNRFSKTITQWHIYDRYIKDMEESVDHHEEAENVEENVEEAQLTLKVEKKIAGNNDVMRSNDVYRSLKILSRLITMNSEKDVYDDFAYYEDSADAYRIGQGVLLPLWRFHDEKIKRTNVTCLAWSPMYKDMFACGCGSYTFDPIPRHGSIAIFSLKNTNRAELVIPTEVGVCSLSWHPSISYLLAVGFYDGSVGVYDVRETEKKKEILKCTHKENKHCEAVWSIHWSREETTGGISFYSISTDGRLIHWTLNRGSLESEDILTLRTTTPIDIDKYKEENPPLPEKKTSLLTDTHAGIALEFHPSFHELFLIATQQGLIYKGSTAHKKKVLMTYKGHTLPVYALSWNPYHPHIFLSASADWTVRLWDDRESTCLRVFDLGRPVADVVWSSYSSTVFSAISSWPDATCVVFDLSENKLSGVCSQSIVKRTRLTRVLFSKHYPVLLIGDMKGGVSCLKLSPNLRKKGVEGDTEEERKEKQIAALQHFIDSITCNP